jgi:hypothetical protein
VLLIFSDFIVLTIIWTFLFVFAPISNFFIRYSICSPSSLALLRKAAEMTLIEMVYFIFSQFNGTNMCDEDGEKELDEWKGEEAFAATSPSTPSSPSPLQSSSGGVHVSAEATHAGPIGEQQAISTNGSVQLSSALDGAMDANEKRVSLQDEAHGEKELAVPLSAAVDSLATTPNPSPVPVSSTAVQSDAGQGSANPTPGQTPISPLSSPLLQKRESRFSERKVSRYFVGTDFDVDV